MEHVTTIEPLVWNSIFVDGQVELYGELNGNLTIGSAGDMWLIDNLTYPNANMRGAWPNERGVIRMKGSLAQRRRGYAHRENHVGTGYIIDLYYDNRLEDISPLGFPDDGAQYISGNQNELHLEARSYVLNNVRARQITVDPGADLKLVGRAPLTVTGGIYINGEIDNPVTIRNKNEQQISTIRGIGVNNSSVNIRHAYFGSNVEIDFSFDSTSISNSKFAYDVYLEGSLQLDSSTFSDGVTLTSYESLSVSRNVFTAGVIIDGNVRDGNFVNNTIVGSSREGLVIRRFRSLKISNNIIAFNRWGIVNRDRDVPEMAYNNVFESQRDNYSECEAGEGSISADPRFVNFEEGDYDLVWNSPCVDAGAELTFLGENPLTVRGYIDLNGTMDEPITFIRANNQNITTFRGIWRNHPVMNLNYVNFADNIDISLTSDSISINNCNIGGQVYLEGSISVDSTVFNGEVTLMCFDKFVVKRSLFTDGVTIDGNVADGRFINNSVVGGSTDGMLVSRFRSLKISNNIIAYNRWGIVNRDRDVPVLEYNNIFGSQRDDYSGCEAGEGSISADPLFVNLEESDYNLMWNSPCVDAGDPESPRDLDGSRADMGAFGINHELSVPDDALLPNNFSVSAYPNPFNDVVTISIYSPLNGEAKWRVFDLTGRRVAHGAVSVDAGVGKVTLSEIMLLLAQNWFTLNKMINT